MYLRWRIWIVFAVLFGLAVPWYWSYLPDEASRLWLGMPVWATSAVVGSLAISMFAAWLLSRRWPHELDLADSNDRGDDRGDDRGGDRAAGTMADDEPASREGTS